MTDEAMAGLRADVERLEKEVERRREQASTAFRDRAAVEAERDDLLARLATREEEVRSLVRVIDATHAIIDGASIAREQNGESLTPVGRVILLMQWVDEALATRDADLAAACEDALDLRHQVKERDAEVARLRAVERVAIQLAKFRAPYGSSLFVPLMDDLKDALTPTASAGTGETGS